jgi:hypothetical protein
MLHMIDDQIEAYRRAVADTAKAQTICQLQATLDNQDNLQSCHEEEQLRLDGLKSIIGMAIREYAAREPCNPFAINDDVNQPASNKHGTFPPPPKSK